MKLVSQTPCLDERAAQAPLAATAASVNEVKSSPAEKKSGTHWMLNGLARVVARNPAEIVRFDGVKHAPSDNTDMRTPDRYWFKQSCKAACGFLSSEIVVHGELPKPGETVIEYANHRSYADGAIAVLSQNPPPLQIAVRHDPADAQSFLGKIVATTVNPMLDFAGCLTVSKPARGATGETAKQGDGAVKKIVAHLAEPGNRFWAAAEGIIGDPKDEGRVAVERIRTGVTVAGLQAQSAALGARADSVVENRTEIEADKKVQAYAMAIGHGASEAIEYGIARLGQMANTAAACSIGLGAVLGMYFSRSDAHRTAFPIVGMMLYGLVNRGINNAVDKRVPNKEKVLAQKPTIHVQVNPFSLPDCAIPIAEQTPDNPQWQAKIQEAKQVIADEINKAQALVAQYELLSTSSRNLG